VNLIILSILISSILRSSWFSSKSDPLLTSINFCVIVPVRGSSDFKGTKVITNDERCCGEFITYDLNYLTAY